MHVGFVSQQEVIKLSLTLNMTVMFRSRTQIECASQLDAAGEQSQKLRYDM